MKDICFVGLCKPTKQIEAALLYAIIQIYLKHELCFFSCDFSTWNRFQSSWRIILNSWHLGSNHTNFTRSQRFRRTRCGLDMTHPIVDPLMLHHVIWHSWWPQRVVAETTSTDIRCTIFNLFGMSTTTRDAWPICLVQNKTPTVQQIHFADTNPCLRAYVKWSRCTTGLASWPGTKLWDGNNYRQQ